jgi:predicted molibdopterin-dependent oxidoreductase YjgC
MGAGHLTRLLRRTAANNADAVSGGAERRLRGHGVHRGEAIQIHIDGEPLEAFAGETVATALIAAHERVFRTTDRGQPRGLYCGIGICFDCLVTVDGTPNRRACMTRVAAGMRVSRQIGWSSDARA